MIGWRDKIKINTSQHYMSTKPNYIPFHRTFESTIGCSFGLILNLCCFDSQFPYHYLHPTWLLSSSSISLSHSVLFHLPILRLVWTYYPLHLSWVLHHQPPPHPASPPTLPLLTPSWLSLSAPLCVLLVWDWERNHTYTPHSHCCGFEKRIFSKLLPVIVIITLCDVKWLRC